MRLMTRITRASATLAGLAVAAMPALAFAQSSGRAPLDRSASEAPAGDGGVLALFVLLLGMGVLIGVIVKMLDLQKKREEEAVHIQAKISDALLLDAALAMLPVTVTAHVGFWRGSPAVLEVAGRLSRPDQREAVL